MRYKQKG